ncbi:MAG: hypothetical protein R3C56_35590 [Pirellulaceae bacterium]
MLTFAGRLIVAGANRIWTANGKQSTCVDAGALKQGEMTPQWSLDCSLKGTMIGAGSNEKPILFIAQGPKIEIRNGSDGTLLNELLLPNVDDAIQYLAVSSAKHAGNVGHDHPVWRSMHGKGATDDAHDGSFTEPTTSTLALAEDICDAEAVIKLTQRVAAVFEQLPVARLDSAGRR